MNFQSRFSAAVFILLFLASCATPVPKIDISSNSLQGVGSIAVIKHPEIKTYTVMNTGSSAMALGALGGVLLARDLNIKQEQIANALKSENYSVSPILTEKVISNLKRQGYNAWVEEAPWEKQGDGFVLSYEKIRSKADNVLVLHPRIIGFVTKGDDDEYLPVITAETVLLDKDRRNVIYRGFHATGWQPRGEGWRFTPATITFADFDAIVNNPKKAAGSLTEAASAIAGSLSNDLKK